MFDARVMRALNVNKGDGIATNSGRGAEPAGSALVPSTSQGLVQAGGIELANPYSMQQVELVSYYWLYIARRAQQDEIARQ